MNANEMEMLQAEVEAIRKECDRALHTLKRWSDEPKAPNTPKILGQPFRSEDVAIFKLWVKAHSRALLRVSRALPETKQKAVARKVVLSSLASHVCAVMRALVRKKIYGSPQLIVEMAKEIKGCKPLTEPVTAWWVPKAKGGFRLMSEDGVRRTAQRLVFRDMVTALGVDSDHDFARRGRGEKALLTKVSTLIDEGYQWWWTPDIKAFFASLKPSHFEWLPLTRQEITNVIFNPKCAKVRIRVPKELKKVTQYVKDTYPFLYVGNTELMTLTTQLVRQGLPQGAVHSPLLARGFLGRELRIVFGDEEGIVGLAYIDDLTIGARLELDAQAAVYSLTERFKSHPAGPLELHSSAALPASSWKVCVLGYFVEPGNGVGGTIHIKPGPRRCGKFRRNLCRRLKRASPDERYDVVIEYWRKWFAGQQAWTTVPGYSESLSENIALSYLDDFEHGIPLGKNSFVKM